MIRKLNKDEVIKKENLQQQFGKRLKQLREGKITQEKLSFELGVDRTYISYLERGKRNPSLYMLSKMAEKLKVKLSDLVDF